MESQQQFGFKEVFTHIIGDMAKAVCMRNGETQQDKYTRSQAATHMILGLQPRDALEAMVAGHIVMLHELMTAGVRELLQGEMDTMRRGSRTTILAMDKAFGINLTRLQCFQNWPSQGTRDGWETQPVQAAAEVTQNAAPHVETSQAEAVEVPANGQMNGIGRPAASPECSDAPSGAVQAQATAPAAPEGEQSPFARAGISLDFTPSPESLAACLANPEAMAAIEAGDPERFARAMGIDQPSAAYLEAAAGLPATLPPEFNRPGGAIPNGKRVAR